MNGYTFLCDLSGFAFDDRGNNPFVPGDWFQVAVSGTFFSPQYGKIEITKQDLATMVRNFREVTPKAPTQLPIDYDHKSDNPELHGAGDAKAAGWVEDLQLRAGGTELWCLPKWTKRAAEMIAAGEYRFVSPYFLTNYLDKATGKKVGPTLKAVAITNRPFLEGMQEIPAPAIAASDTAVAEFGADEHVAVSTERSMKEKPKGMKMEDEEEEDDLPVTDGEGEEGEDGPALSCPTCGAPVSHDGGHKHKTPEAKAAAGAKKVIDQVKKALDEGELGADREGDPDYKAKGAKKMAEDTSLETRFAALEQKLNALEVENRQLREKNEATETALKALQTQRQADSVESLLSRGLSEGKLNPKLIGTAEKPGWARSFALRDAQGFEQWLEDAPQIVELGERGSSDEQAADGATATASRIHELVSVAMSEHKGLTYSDATKKVLAEHRALAEAYDNQMIGERHSAAAAASNIRRL